MSSHSSSAAQSPAEIIRKDPAAWEALYSTSPPEVLEKLQYQWKGFWARPDQIPPEDDDWLTWFIRAGRGFGKTRTGAETVRDMVENHGAKRVAFVAPTAGDCRDVMVEGESGILACCPPWNKPTYEPSKRRLVWPNGALATMYSADEPERLRGPQHDFAWCDELGSWRYAEGAWDMLMFGLRLGRRPRVIITTTPKPTKLIRDLCKAQTTRVTTGSTYANAQNLAASFLQVIANKYEGTRLGQQELYANILDEAEGALWNRAMMDAAHAERFESRDDWPDFRRIVVAIDPAASNTQTSDETGLVVAGQARASKRFYVLQDASGRYTPQEWATKAVSLYNEYDADRIIGEVNNGGDMVEAVIRNVAPNVSYRKVHASRGKAARAEPIAALYEQDRVTHLCTSADLEDQLCTWEPLGDEKSPDRLDALVWALTELSGGKRAGKVAKPIVTGSGESLRGSLPGHARRNSVYVVSGPAKPR
jgi:phage terminase large subunit-like protein